MLANRASKVSERGSEVENLMAVSCCEESISLRGHALWLYAWFVAFSEGAVVG